MLGKHNDELPFVDEAPSTMEGTDNLYHRLCKA
jgi:hypothetical protein